MMSNLEAKVQVVSMNSQASQQAQQSVQKGVKGLLLQTNQLAEQLALFQGLCQLPPSQMELPLDLQNLQGAYSLLLKQTSLFFI
mgnify:CR=1 FL=1